MNEVEFNTKLEFKNGLSHAHKSGIKCVTIRNGVRHYSPNITVYGYVAKVESQRVYKLSEVPFETLQKDGFTSFSHAISTLKEFYPEIEYDSPVTVIEFRMIVPPVKLY